MEKMSKAILSTFFHLRKINILEISKPKKSSILDYGCSSGYLKDFNLNFVKNLIIPAMIFLNNN